MQGGSGFRWAFRSVMITKSFSFFPGELPKSGSQPE